MNEKNPGMFKQAFKTTAKGLRVIDNYINVEEMESFIEVEESRVAMVNRLVALGHTKAKAVLIAARF